MDSGGNASEPCENINFFLEKNPKCFKFLPFYFPLSSLLFSIFPGLLISLKRMPLVDLKVVKPSLWDRNTTREQEAANV